MNFWTYVWQFGVIAACSFAGELLNYFLPLPIPAAVWGLVLMLVLLCTGIVKVDKVKPTGPFLAGIMTLMFVPAVVRIIAEWEQVKTILLPGIVIVVVSTVLVLGAAGKVTDLLIGKEKESSDE